MYPLPFISNDAPGHAPDPALLGLDVRGRGISTSVDTDELNSVAGELEAAERSIGWIWQGVNGLLASLERRAHEGPVWGASAVAAVAAITDGPVGSVQLAADIDQLRSAVVRAARVYERAELEPGDGRLVPEWIAVVSPLARHLNRAHSAASTFRGLLDRDEPGAVVLEDLLRRESTILQYLTMPWWRTGESDPATMHPIQRVGTMLAAVGARGTGNVRVERGDHYALGPTRNLGDAIRALQSVREGESVPEGTIGIARAEHADGTTTWTVLLPGTQETTLGGANPLDMTTNVQGFVGEPTDVADGVVQALADAGAGEGDEIAFVGHSQGGIVANRLVADLRIRERYRPTTVLSAGSPVANIALPEGVNAIALEHPEDVIVALDANDPANDPHRVVVTRHVELDPEYGDPRFGEDTFAQTHGADAYARTADLLDQVNQPRVAEITEDLSRVLGGDDAEVTVWRYRLERVDPAEVTEASADGARQPGGRGGSF